MDANAHIPSGQEPEPYRDEFLEEVHRLKEAASAEFDHDLGRIIAHLKEIERRYAGRVVQPPTDRASDAA
jgi:hypothetical protein